MSSGFYSAESDSHTGPRAADRTTDNNLPRAAYGGRSLQYQQGLYSHGPYRYPKGIDTRTSTSWTPICTSLSDLLQHCCAEVIAVVTRTAAMLFIPAVTVRRRPRHQALNLTYLCLQKRLFILGPGRQSSSASLRIKSTILEIPKTISQRTVRYFPNEDPQAWGKKPIRECTLQEAYYEQEGDVAPSEAALLEP